MKRCAWCGSDPLYVSYHDNEWGVPAHDDGRLFEMLVLEGAQAGLSWYTILKRRENYRKAFDNFDVETIASYTDADIRRLLADPGIIRNRLKVAAAVKNAIGVRRIKEAHGSLNDFLWRYVDFTPIQNAWKQGDLLPSESAHARQMSRDLKKMGFGFTGPVICYSFMQSVGMVNDHFTDCFRYEEIKLLGES
jgi:DNA-3-methyladenine glycosylase I